MLSLPRHQPPAPAGSPYSIFEVIQMKKIYPILLSVTLLLSLTSCGSQDAPAILSTPAQTSSTTSTQKEWTASEVRALFLDNSDKAHWTVLDCVAAPDGAYGLAGVVLFTDDQDDLDEPCTYAAFVDADGNKQVVATQAFPAEDPELTYQGNGTVTFHLLHETDRTDTSLTLDAYTHTLSYALDADGGIHFTASDDLPKDKQ